MKKILQWIIPFALLFPFVSSGQGIIDNFNDNILGSSWQTGAGYYLFEDNMELRIQSSKQAWEEFYYVFPAAIDLSANPRVTVKVKSNQDFFLAMGVIDANGNDNRGDAFIQLKAKVWGNREYMDVTFDFSGKPGTADFTKIQKIILIFNPAYGVNATIKLDDFKVGSDAPAFPRMEFPMAQTVPMGNVVQTVKLNGITNGTTVTATSSNPAIISDPSVSVVANGMATLTYIPNANQSGSVAITTTVSGTGYTSLVIPFNIIVNNNLAPTIEQLDDQIVSSGKPYSIKLTNIYDGNTEVEQTITVSAVSSDQSVIPNNNLSVDYGVKTKTNAILTFIPNSISSGSKTANITVTINDNGGTANGGIDTKTMTFKVTVYSQYYKAPIVNVVPDNLYAGIGVSQISQITGISDGNDGRNIGSITASIVPGTDQSITVKPVINYTAGSDNATITYSTSQLGNSKVVITVTNAGAPANSNGNSSVTDTFTVRGIEVPITGYTEDFSASDILGADYYSTNQIPQQLWASDFNKYPQKWFVEGQGIEQTLTLDPANKKAKIEVHKPNMIPRTFAGTWFSPRKLFDLSNNKYLSIKVSAVPPTVIAFDIFDVNFKRYYKLIPQKVSGTDKVLTFTFNDTPGDADLDFSKIALILINVSNLTTYDGTITISELKIGDQAENAPAPPVPLINISAIGNRTLFTNAPTQKIDISNIYVTKEGVINYTKPVSLAVTSSNTTLIPTPTLSDVVKSTSLLTFTPAAGQTGSSTITVKATADGATTNTSTFTIDVKDKNAAEAVEVVYEPSVTYQTITGLGNFSRNTANDVDDLGSSILRIGWGFGANDLEYFNDNNDSKVLDLSKFTNDPSVITEILKSKDRGVTKVFATVWSPQYWMKSNLSYNVPFFSFQDNILDSVMYDEFAEWIVGSTLKFKEDVGMDLYAVSIQNECEFDEPYGSAKYTPQQLKAAAILVGQRFKALGIPTKVLLGEMLPAQGHVLDYFQAANNDPVAKDLVEVFSIHNYDADGINVGGAGADQWKSYFQEAQRIEPKKELWMSETSGFPATPYGAMTIAGNIYNALKYGNINAWIFWDATPSTYGMGFYVQKNYYKYIRPNAVRTEIISSDSLVLALSFKNSDDNTVSVILINKGTTEKQVKLKGTDLPEKMYVYQTAENINCVLVDSISSAGSYLTLLPSNSVTTLYNVKTEAVTAVDSEIHNALESIVIFPNPANYEINISLPENEVYTEITLTDLVGRKVGEKQLGLNHGKIETINLDGLNSGVFILHLKGIIETHTFKILKK